MLSFLLKSLCDLRVKETDKARVQKQNMLRVCVCRQDAHCASRATSTKLVSACDKDILLSESLDVIVALLQPAPEPARLLLVFLVICEAYVRRDGRCGVIELLKELTIPEINLSHFSLPKLCGYRTHRGQRSKQLLCVFIRPRCATWLKCFGAGEIGGFLCF